MLASLGDFTFEVNAQNITTFTDLKFQNSANYTEHKILNRKGLLEFTGLNASTASLNIHLDSQVSEDIEGTISYFYEMMNAGEALLFMIGDNVMGEGFWVIESLDESYTRIDNLGRFLMVDLALKLKEYIEDAE